MRTCKRGIVERVSARAEVAEAGRRVARLKVFPLADVDAVLAHVRPPTDAVALGHADAPDLACRRVLLVLALALLALRLLLQLERRPLVLLSKPAGTRGR